MTPPSIFNDVLGPVMRGPSSSHSAASLRIGRLARDLMGGTLTEVLVEYDPDGSLVTTHESQGSDLGLFGGLLGWDTDDERLPEYREEFLAQLKSLDSKGVSHILLGATPYEHKVFVGPFARRFPGAKVPRPHLTSVGLHCRREKKCLDSPPPGARLRSRHMPTCLSRLESAGSSDERS